MDMLIPLYGRPRGDALEMGEGIQVRSPLAPEFDLIVSWIEAQFGQGWASECRIALSRDPVACHVAVRDQAILGFCCYDAMARGFVGPIGVLESARGQGIGAALLLACLHDMRTMGYGYAIAGHVGAPEFFKRVAGAVEIPDSTPGIYANLLR